MKLGFIDYYLDEWHANNYPRMIREASHGQIEVAYAYGMITSPLTGKTTDQWCQEMGIARCHSIEELIEKSDGLIVLSPDNCEQHEGLCQLPLRSGKPCFVDKTFTPDGATARRLFEIAKAHHSPCFSTSALRFASEYQGLSGINQLSSWGGGLVETYVIHQLEPIMMLMGYQPERALFTGSDDMAAFMLDFGQGRLATLHCFQGGAPFMMQAVGDKANQMIEVKSDFFGLFIQTLVSFMQSGKPPVKPEDTIAIMQTRGAMLRAMDRPGEWVNIAG